MIATAAPSRRVPAGTGTQGCRSEQLAAAEPHRHVSPGGVDPGRQVVRADRFSSGQPTNRMRMSRT